MEETQAVKRRIQDARYTIEGEKIFFIRSGIGNYKKHLRREGEEVGEMEKKILMLYYFFSHILHFPFSP